MALSSDDLFKYQKLYKQEKDRLDASSRAESAAKIKQDYAEKIKSAKDSVKIEKLKNDEILKLQKLSNKEYLASLKSLAEAESDIVKSLKSEITEIYKSISETAENNIEEVLKCQQKFADKLGSYKDGKLLRYNVYGGGTDGKLLSYDMLNDYAQTNQELLDYYNSVSSVRKRIEDSGFDKTTGRDFLSVLSDMSVEDGIRFSDALLGASDLEFKNVIGGYLQNTALTKRISSELFSEDFKTAVSDTADYMKSRLSQLGFEIPENFTVSGTVSADNFGTAFVDRLDGYLENIRDMISSFNASLQTSALGFGESYGSNTSNVTYNQSFSIGSVKQSAYEQISAWKNASYRAKLRGQ